MLASLLLATGLPSAEGDGGAGDADALAQALIRQAGIRPSLCAMPRIGDGKLAIALVRSGVQLVHGLAPDAPSAASAREPAAAAGLLGVRVMVEEGRPASLPLADRLADLVVVADATDANLEGLPPAEMARVLGPYRGVAMIGNASGRRGTLARAPLAAWAGRLGEAAAGTVEIIEAAGGPWAVVRKRAEPGMDEWTHFWHNPGNNAVSRDTVFRLAGERPAGTPRALIQYITPPTSGTGGSARVAGGRLFEAQGQQYKSPMSASLEGRLWCRNAHNGQILWERRLPRPVEAKQAGTFVATAEALYLIDADRPAVQVIDPETGGQRRVIRFPEVAGQCKWLAVEDGILYALFGDPAPPFPAGATYHNNAGGVWSRIMEGKLRHGRTLCAFDLAADRPLWSHTPAPDLIDCRGLGVWLGRIALLVEAAAGQGLDAGGDESVAGARLLCLDGRTGRRLWENADPALRSLKRRYQYVFGREWTPELICAADGIRLRMIGIYSNDILFFDPATGALRWKLDRDDKATPQTFAGFFVKGTYVQKGVWDALTGKRLTEKIPWDGGCGMRTASPAGIFGNENSATVGMPVKSDCHMGSFVAEGLLHVPRGWCHCEGIWRGTFAFAAPGEVDAGAAAGADRLQTGGDPPAADPGFSPTAADWPMYRHDAERTAASPVAMADQARLRWHAKPMAGFSFSTDYNRYSPYRQDQPTEPVAVGGAVFLGASDGQLACLDAEDGRRRWTFWTGGRIYAPPAVWNGRLYAGSMDGCVYCLDAATGRLVWRFRCAPADQRILVAGHLVSRWPVQGGVLVRPTPDAAGRQGIVFAAAGIADAMGTQVFALDAETGRVVWRNIDAGETTKEKAGVTPSGFLTVQQGMLYLRSRNGLAAAFDLQTGAQTPLPEEVASKRRHLGLCNQNLGPAGREIAVLGGGWILEGGRLLQHEQNQREGDRGYDSFSLKRYDAHGQLALRARLQLSEQSIIPPAFDGGMMLVVPGGWGRYKRPDGSSEEGFGGSGGTAGLVALDQVQLMSRMEEVARQADAVARSGKDPSRPLPILPLLGQEAYAVPSYAEMLAASPAFRWRHPDPRLQVYAVALAANAVVATIGIRRPGATAWETAFTSWAVLALDRKDGKELWRCELPGEPVLCSLALDRSGRALVSLRDGGVACIGGD